VLLPTHLAVGYVLGELFADFVRRRWAGSRVSNRIVITTMLFAILPDVDVLWWAIKKGAGGLGGSLGGHHMYATHVPVFYLLAAVIAHLFVHCRSSGGLLITAALLGSMSHFVLDSFLIGWGIMWLYPFSSRLIGWNVVTYRYGAIWGDRWLQHYLVHPFALIEYGLILLALIRAKRKRHPNQESATQAT
jgi:hypothetical protein